MIGPLIAIFSTVIAILRTLVATLELYGTLTEDFGADAARSTAAH